MSERIAIVGVGLIGGSFGLALKAGGFDGEIVGIGRDAERLRVALDMGAIDRAEIDAVLGVQDADVVLLAVPMGAMRPVLEIIATGIGPETIVTDAGSAKGAFVEDARAVFGSLERVVPGHPVAGTERSGAEAAFPELFRDRRVILTPVAETREEAVATVERLWTRTGATVERLGVEQHDRLLAATSHLPHMLAFGLVDALARAPEADALFRYAAGGFRDFTRIASSDPAMWRDICIANRVALLDALQAYRDDLDALTEEVRNGDAEGLQSRFTRAKTARDRFCG